MSHWKGIAIGRFRQLKEEGKKKLSKALPAEDINVATGSDADEDGSDEDSPDKVNLCKPMHV